MFEKEEKELLQWREKQSIPLPSELAFEQAIRAGMQQAQQHKQRHARRSRRMRQWGMMAATLLLCFIGLVRFSPAVAAYAGQIPGVKALVELIHQDKGLSLAVDNNLLQEVGVTDVHEGVALGIHSLIADEERLVLFFQMENLGERGNVHIERLELIDPNGEPIRQGYSIGYSYNDNKPDWTTKDGKIDISFHDGTSIPSSLTLRVKLFEYAPQTEMPVRAGAETDVTERNGQELASTWELPITIDLQKFKSMKQVYSLNHTVVVDGQTITFQEMTILPTRIRLDVRYSPSNTKRIFGFNSLELLDQDGEVFGAIRNGISASHPNEDHVIYYLESLYFKQPEEVTLRVNGIRALDKAKLAVKVDLEQQKLLSAPDERLQLERIREEGQYYFVHFALDTEGADFHRSLISSSYKDESGHMYHSSYSSFYEDENIQHYEVRIDKKKYTGAVIFEVQDYLDTIEEEIKLVVPVQ